MAVNTPAGKTTLNTRLIHATAETIYRALTDPDALSTWAAPGNMMAKVHRFDLRIGGGYSMTLTYPESEKEAKGKTTAKEDRYTARFLALTPAKQVVAAITFDSDDPAFAGEMIMDVRLEPAGADTCVTFLFRNIPAGIRPEDNEAGTAATLEKLACYVA